MKKRILSIALVTAFMAVTTGANAAILQQIQIANMLYNMDATSSNPGVTPDSVVVKLFTAAAPSTACYTATIAYQSSVSITTGTGQACTAAAATMTVAPVASATVGTVYTAPATYTFNADYTQQILIQQKPDLASPSTQYGPVFDTTNGLVTTPGTAVVLNQSHIALGK